MRDKREPNPMDSFRREQQERMRAMRARRLDAIAKGYCAPARGFHSWPVSGLWCACGDRIWKTWEEVRCTL